jgi:hypothetical protein
VALFLFVAIFVFVFFRPDALRSSTMNGFDPSFVSSLLSSSSPPSPASTSRGNDDDVRLVDFKDEIVFGVPIAKRLVRGRADVVAQTWATAFRNVVFGSLDPIDVSELTSDSIHAQRYVMRTMKPLANEEFDPARSASWNTLPLLLEMWDHCSQCKWFFVADDDTALNPLNIMRYVRAHNETAVVFQGKGVGYPRYLFDAVGYGAVSFAVGGSGYFMSRPLVARMIPQIRDCANATTGVQFSDARVAACIGLLYIPNYECRTCRQGEPILPCWMLRPYYKGAPGLGVNATKEAVESVDAVACHWLPRRDAEAPELRQFADYFGKAGLVDTSARDLGRGWPDVSWSRGPSLLEPRPSADDPLYSFMAYALPQTYLAASPGNATEASLLFNRRRTHDAQALSTWRLHAGHAHLFRGVSFESYAKPGHFLTWNNDSKAVTVEPRDVDRPASTTFAVLPCHYTIDYPNDNDIYMHSAGQRLGDFSAQRLESYLLCVYAGSMKRSVTDTPPSTTYYGDELFFTLHKFQPWAAHAVFRASLGNSAFTLSDAARAVAHAARTEAQPDEPSARAIAWIDANFRDASPATISQQIKEIFGPDLTECYIEKLAEDTRMLHLFV